ncbi:glycosyltransferase family 69 protein [Aspergillus puulaauensis]|uniref:Cryptococcal mannosyltransferase 1-domain-containing protein n=1 Tax=Aspergillus puulaauensis TaxID=1220207 RepID=A0A7R8AMH5_9EURO|nr:uncharacterized protein APUU_40246A [Aspergillus puulaauensis]BCS23802.1 hypothetical protein APUU_40246A [Aspergillus puulaauensis]
MSGHLLSRHDSPAQRLSVEDCQEAYDLYEVEAQRKERSLLERVLQRIYSVRYLFSPGGDYHGNYRPLIPTLVQPRRFRRILFRLPYYGLVVLSAILILTVFTATFFPSYTSPPPHYSSLSGLASASDQAGRGNPRNEKVFIAASLYDLSGELVWGHWGSSILQLIDLLGEDNAFLSIYENDSGAEGKQSLADLKPRVPCNNSIIYEHHLGLEELPKIIVPGGKERVKRISYLAETRNRALQPLDEPTQAHFDKILFLNDVAFNPVEALQLLFSTNVNDDGIAQYRAACAVDFINPFKFYDTYATRDLEGYSMGLPFYPWFSNSGSAQSRKDVLSGKDAVPVRSCWGGMVAFDAQFFQHDKGRLAAEAAGGNLPARFRASQDVNMFWDASECCLIHADIQVPREHIGESGDNEVTETGIYMNPFVRVAYDERSLSWLWTTRRFEKLYSILHNIGNHLVGLPWFNPRRKEVPGQRVQDAAFINDEGGAGSFRSAERTTSHDGFCGRLGLQVVVPHREEGKGFESIPMPRS